ncbi:MAG: serine/threonine-protein kinase [Thermoanaerobaculia bacterium]
MIIPPKPPSQGGLQRDLRVQNYVLEKRLGIGFSAEVWSAIVADVPPGVELAQGASVAIKFFQPHFLMVPDQVIRIEREYRLASALRHPNLIRIYEFMLASSRPHHNFIVMDVARGESLRNVIPRTGMSPTKVIQIAKQLLTALDALHAAGALHRDVKPGNIAVADDDKGLQTTLLDLGIVSLTHEKNLTVSSRFLGSKHWAPYEQLIGQPLDARADLYSVGAVVYNMLTGIEPYANQHTEAAVAVTMRDHAIEIPPVMAPALTDLFNRCLSTNRDHRPSNASECLAIIDAKS